MSPMKEALIERSTDRPDLKEVKRRGQGRLHVAEHEFAHIVAIWGVGKSIRLASVEATSEYLGVTIPAESMSPSQMQIATMASAEHDGNGSDQAKAYYLQERGMGMEAAEKAAKSIIGRYEENVLRIAAMYLAAKGKADEFQLRTFLRWAEEEVKEQEEYAMLQRWYWSDDLEEKRKEYLHEEDSDDQNESAPIHYLPVDRARMIDANGKEKTLCNLCHGIDGHAEGCANQEKPRQTFKAEEFDVFAASDHTDYFSSN